MHVKHLSVHFPKFLDAGEEYELENDSLHMFASIENHATNLKTLSLCPARKDFVKLRREDRSIVAEKLSMLQKHLQAIPSLEKNFVEVCWRFPRQHLLKQIEKYGMKVKIVHEPFGACRGV